MKRSIFLGVLIILCLNIFAQNVEFTKYNFPDRRKALSDALDHIKEGDKYFEEGPGMYSFAIEQYMKANEFNPNNALLNYKIGRAHLVDNDKSTAIKYLEKAYSLNPKIAPEVNDINYLLARAYHLNYEFDKAIAKYKEHMNSLNPEQIALQKKRIDKQIEECEVGKKLVADPVRVFIDNMGPLVNSAYSDYSPLINPDENMLIFTSTRENTTGGKRDDDSYYYEDIYVSYYKNGKWSIPTNTLNVNGKNHDATAGISADGKVLFIYQASNGGDIFKSELLGGEYQKIDRMDKEINTNAQETSASLSYDGTTLYFTSEREGGYGGSDIYYTKKDSKGRWSDAVNMGAAVNTPYDENNVFMSIDEKSLYFSSNGHKSMGGYDVYRSDLVDGRWTEPVNLGYPINTPENDVFFTLATSGKRAYYSSKKKLGHGSYDIYMVTLLGEAKPMINNYREVPLAFEASNERPYELEPKIEQQTVLTGAILDAVTLQPVQSTIEITDNSKGTIIASFENNSTTGNYLISLMPGFNYGIAVNSEGYLFHSENFNIPEDAMARRIKKDIMLKKVEVGSKIVLNNIFFDFDKATLRPESEVELDRLYKLLQDVPTLRIEISGHTDNIGSAQYNQKLSKERAKTVVNYLVDKGIDRSRLEYAGYGFERPIAPNDTEEGRQMNRRTEFEVLSK